MYQNILLGIIKTIYIIFDPFIRRLSYFTYSHRVKNGKVNSSRIAYGAAINHMQIYEHALEVIKERKIKCEIIPDKNILFGGLGWDIESGHFKIYYRFLDYKKLGSRYKKLSPDMTGKCRSGLLSITYDNDGNILERKLYGYPKNERVAYLKSEKRSDIQQDCDKYMDWRPKVGDAGKKILKMYRKDGYWLDAITYKDDMNYTMYFPVVG